MNKIIIPSSVAVLACSIAVASKALTAGSVELLSKAYMLAALSSAIFLLLLLEYLLKGLHNLSNLEQAKIDEEQMEQRFEVERLYEDKEHTDEFLKGFATAAEFFIENYLSESTPGVTEKQWFEYVTKAYKTEFINTEKLYRSYIIHALMDRSSITTEEYGKIARMTESAAVRHIYGKVLYQSDFMVNQGEQIKQSYDEVYETKEQDKNH